MKLLESKMYQDDLSKAIKNIDLKLLDNKTFFITGGLGLIGSTIVDVLITYGKTGKIYIGARDYNQFKKRFGGFNNVRYIPYNALEKLQLDKKINFIIHGAGLASPELYTSNPVETMLSNFDGIHSLLEYARSENVERVLYISSSEVYGKKSIQESFKEDTYGIINIDNIRSSYAITKCASEMLCKSYNVDFGVDTVVVRPGHIFGPSAQKTDRRISSEFAYQAASRNELIMKSSGMQKRSYCYSIDCAIQILTVLIKGKSNQAYNIGHDEVVTIREMAEILAKAGNTSLSAIEASEEEKKNFNPMCNSSLDNNKVKNLGYVDTFSVEEGLIHTVEILREIELVNSR